MHMRTFILKFGFSFAVLMTSAFAETGQLTKLETLRLELSKLENDWAKNRSETISVLDIKGLNAVDGDNERKMLENRLETLQNKKISNREWAQYWKTEASLSASIAAIYRELVNGDSESLLKAEERHKAGAADAARVKRRSLREAYKSAIQRVEVAEKLVRELMNNYAEALREVLEQTTQLQAKVEQAQRRLEKIAQQIEREKRPQRLEALRVTQSELGQAMNAFEEELKRLSNAGDATARAEKLIQAILAREETATTALPDGEAAKLKQYLDAKATAERLSRDVSAADDNAAALKEQSERAKRELVLYTRRVIALDEWAVLAQKKVDNQERYYEAIEGDIAAINERLRGVRTPKEAEEKVYAADVCDAEPDDEQTPFAHHQACARAIRSELKRVSMDIEQFKQKAKLTDRLRASSKKLIAAQEIDEQLVQREARISESELTRCKQSGEDKDWVGIWTQYANRANDKQGKLKTAVTTSKVTERTLGARAGVYDDTLKRLSENRDRSADYLKTMDTPVNTVIAVATTALQIIRVGWPALIYIMVAFLIIRLIRKNRDRLEQKALLAQEGKGNEELDALIKELEDATERGDDEDVIQLTNVIGNAESKIKDEGQRIGTIARVAAQALSLMVYIATALLVLDALTIDIKPILGGAAIFGLAISFGSQSLVKDVVSGFFILLENQYAVGDVVTINAQSGTVEKVTLRRTVLRDIRGGVHNITNGSISSVKNNTQGWARVIIDVGVAYGTDVAMVEEVINTVGNEMYRDPKWRGKLTEVPSFVGVIAFKESEITVRAWFQTRTFQNWGAEREFNRRLKHAFEKAGVQIPFPQRELRIVREVEIQPDDA